MPFDYTLALNDDDPIISDDYLSVQIVSAAPESGVRIAVRGELDSVTAPRLTAVVVRALSTTDSGRIELEFSRVRFVDAAGARCLMACRQVAGDAGIDLVLRHPAPAVIRVLDVLGLLGHLGLTSADVRTGPIAIGERPDSSAAPDHTLELSAQIRRQARDARHRARSVVERNLSILPTHPDTATTDPA
jgi:anti-anti-sigma factor